MAAPAGAENVAKLGYKIVMVHVWNPAMPPPDEMSDVHTEAGSIEVRYRLHPVTGNPEVVGVHGAVGFLTTNQRTRSFSWRPLATVPHVVAFNRSGTHHYTGHVTEFSLTLGAAAPIFGGGAENIGFLEIVVPVDEHNAFYDLTCNEDQVTEEW